MSIEEYFEKNEINCNEDYVSYETICQTIKEYILDEGPKETMEIISYVERECPGVSKDRVRNALHQKGIFSSTKWKDIINDVLEPRGLREPYKKWKNAYVWEVEEINESEKEKRLVNFARKKSKN